MPNIDAILMASGFSRRFGPSNKLLAPFCGSPLISHTLKAVCNAKNIRHVFCVYADAALLPYINAYKHKVTAIHNDAPQRGACESIRLGVSASTADYYMFFPCDQPMLGTGTIEQIAQAALPHRIVIPYHQTPGSPVVFSSTYRHALLTLQDGQTGKNIQKQHPEEIIQVYINSSLALIDVDTQEQLTQLEATAKAHPIG